MFPGRISKRMAPVVGSLVKFTGDPLVVFVTVRVTVFQPVLLLMMALVEVPSGCVKW